MNYQRFRPQIAALLDPQFHSIEQVDEAVASGEALGWFSDKSALIGFIEDYEAGAKVFRAMWAAGSLKDIANNIRPQVEEFARANGCTSILAQGRGGWVRVLQEHGFRPSHVVVRKDF